PLELLRPTRGSFPALELEVTGDDRASAGAWNLNSSTSTRAVFTLPLASGVVATKTVSLTANYGVDVTLGFANPGTSATTLSYTLVGETGMTPEDEGHTSVPHEDGI